MLGIRLSAEAEARLERHARAAGRGKSVIAREWIMERLEKESIDTRLRRAAEHLARHETPERLAEAARIGAQMLHVLDEEDGGYDWGEAGPSR